MSTQPGWDEFCEGNLIFEDLGIALDVSRYPLGDYLQQMDQPMAAALAEMAELEAGAIANPDENRMVGHYWLRDPDLAPDQEIAAAIRHMQSRVVQLAGDLRSAKLTAPSGKPFEHILIAGIGGSSLGPRLVLEALTDSTDGPRVWFFDNTDPDGFDRIFSQVRDRLDQTLTIVISKSGGTKETRNAMLEIEHAYKQRGVSFPRCAIAITGEKSELHESSVENGWLATLPMWDWVGGRTSVMSAVGLLPAAICGVDVAAFLEGAARMDALTRGSTVAENPAALLVLVWHHALKQQQRHNMVVIPYKDRLCLLAGYLQQLVMESLGKGKDRAGQSVAEGLTVYGNKGSTDQHAYVQQLREGAHDFFAIFLGVLQSRSGGSIEVEPGVTSGDYLWGFLLGTRDALYENDRSSVTISLDRLDAASVGAIIALFERVVGLYASLINVNAYHQPGVEAGKKAAGQVIALQRRILGVLKDNPSQEMSVDQIARAIGIDARKEWIYNILEHLASDTGRGVRRVATRHPAGARYCLGQA